MSGRQAITPSEFVKALRGGDAGAMEEKHVEGFVSLRGETIAWPVRALNTHFEGDVDLSDCTFEADVDFSGCTFARTLSLRNASIDGDLVFDDVQVHDLPTLWHARMPDLPALDLRGAAVSGDLRLLRSAVAGRIEASAMRIGGNLSLLGIEVDESVDIANASVGADFQLGVWSSGETHGNWRGCAIRGHLNGPNMALRGTFTLEGAQIAGDAAFWGSRLDGSVFARPFVTPPKAQEGTAWPEPHATRTHIGGDLNFAASRIAGHVQIESTTVEGWLRLLSLTSAAVALRPFTDRSLGAHGPTSLGGLDLSAARIGGYLSLVQLQITGTCHDNGRSGAAMRNVKVDGDLICWSYGGAGGGSGRGGDPLRDGAVVLGDFDARNAEVAGECRLTNIAVSGTIRLNDARVRGDIALRSAATLLDDPDCDRDLRDRLLRGEPPVRARARAIDLSMARCDNDIDLTGLDLTPAGGDGASDAAGGIKAVNLAAAGEIQLYAQHDASGVESWTVITGAADFTGVRAGGLAISAHGFEADRPDEREIESKGLRLVGAELGELNVVAIRRRMPARRRLGGGRIREMFPTPVDLRDMTVRVWSIGGDRRTSVAKFKSLLMCDPVFRRDTYVRVEEMLRNGGHTDDANAIYREMKRKGRAQQWRDSRVWWWPLMAAGQVIWHWPFAWLLGFGTAPDRLFGVIIAIWALSLPIYYEPANYEPSLAYRQANDLDPALADRLSPDPAAWRGATPVFASMQYHLPVIGTAVREEWELRDRGDVCWAWRRLSAALLPASRTGGAEPGVPGGCAGVRLSVTPEDAGLLITVLNWALWPLVLTFWVRKLLR